MSIQQRVELMTRLAWLHIGQPYKWGGDDPVGGYDCSGFVIELLKAVGIIPRGFDTTAEGLRARFSREMVDIPFEGCLMFRVNSSGVAKHVEYCISLERTIGFSGGGWNTKTLEDAMKNNAYCKLRPIQFGDNIIFNNPFGGI